MPTVGATRLVHGQAAFFVDNGSTVPADKRFQYYLSLPQFIQGRGRREVLDGATVTVVVPTGEAIVNHTPIDLRIEGMVSLLTTTSLDAAEAHARRVPMLRR